MAAAPARKRSHRRLIIGVSLFVIVAVVAVALLAYAITHQQPVMSLSSTTVSPGDTITVTASKLPPNQIGDFELYSQPFLFPFHADGNGAVTASITIPSEIAGGDHYLKICYAGACHGQAVIYVLTALASPTPVVLPSPSFIPSPLPSSFPSPSKPPSPGVPQLALSQGSVAPHGTLGIYGVHFPPERVVSIVFFQGTASHALSPSPVVNPQGTFVVDVTIPATATPGLASVRACAGSACAYATFTVT